MKKYSVSDIFTPSSPAEYTFVEREFLNDMLIDALHTKGKQIIIFGHTGTGKTTLLLNKLSQTYEDFVTSRCTSDMSFSQLVLNAFDSLNKYFISDIISEKNRKINVNLSNDYKLIKTSIGFENTSKSVSSFKPLVPPQLTPQKLASFFGETNACWVIDDFHKLNKAEKRMMAQWMKVFMDESVNYPQIKIIVIGAVGKAKEVIELDKELNNRVVEIHVPFMEDEELEKIIHLGESKLNITIVREVKNKIVKFSSGLPSVTHQLCLNLCHSKALYETSEQVLTFDLNDFEDAINSFLQQNAGYLSSIYEQATQQDRKDIDKKIPIHYHVLKCFILSKKNNLSIDDVYKYFKEYQHPQPEEALRYLLNQMTQEKRGNVLSYDEDSETWFISNPFFKVYCLCIMDLSKTKIQAQMELFSIESIDKLSKKNKAKQKELITKILKSGDYFDF